MEEGTSWDPEPKRRLKPPTKFKPRDLEGVARFLNASSDFWVFRRFGKLHLFNLLRLELVRDSFTVHDIPQLVPNADLKLGSVQQNWQIELFQ